MEFIQVITLIEVVINMNQSTCLNGCLQERLKLIIIIHQVKAKEIITVTVVWIN